MATTNISGTQVLRYPTEYQLSLLNLATSMQGAGVVNLMPFLVELSLFEDIYGNTISGQLILSDALGLISNFSMSGNEFLQIQLKKTEQDSFGISRNYRIYKISHRTAAENNNYESYILNFCSEEFLVAEQYRISKSYKSKKISEIITSILKDYVKVGQGKTKTIHVSETQGTYDFILPNKRLFETINWLSTYALPLPNAGEGADMLFFENADGYWFKSLQELYVQPVYRTFSYAPKNVSVQNIDQQLANVYDFEVLNLFDTLKAITNGTFSNRLISLDPVQRKSTVTDFNYDTYFTKGKKINASPVTNNLKNRWQKAIYDAPPGELNHGTLRMVPGNSEQKKQPFVAGAPNTVAPDIFIEKTMPNRVAQIALANYTKIKITVAGDPLLTVGRVVDFEYLKDDPSTSFLTSGGNSMRKSDPLLSGKYLITASRHILRNNSYMTILELCKDSYQQQLASFDSSLQPLVDGKQV